MALTPNDILNKEFNNKFRGYDANEVNDYLDIIVSDYESMIAENNRLKQDLASAKEKNEYFAQLQDSLNSSIVVAQEAADRLKQNARKEAELILFEAEREADRVVSNASDTAKSIVTESEALRRSSKSYRSKLEKMIREQLDVVSSEEYIELFDRELETNLNPSHFQEASQRVNDRVDRLEEQDAENFAAAQQITNNRYKNDFDQETYTQTSRQVSTEEIEEQEIDSANEETRVISVDEIEQLNSTTNNESNQNPEQEDKESVLGQTIRIDLPKD